MLDFSDTSYGRKLLFNTILSNELAICKYKINAFYEWKSKDRVFFFKFQEERTVKLGINLNFDREDFFRGSEKAAKLSILYRAYFIANYVRCLEGASEAEADTFFQGLVVLEAIEDIHCEAMTAAYSPLWKKRIRQLRPIDVHCAIRSLTRILIEQQDCLSPQGQASCESAINHLISYTCLPEIQYNRGKKPEYGLVRDLKCLQKMTETKPEVLSQYALFHRRGLQTLEEQTVVALLSNESLCGFWPEAAMRLLAFSARRKLVLDAAQYPCLLSCLRQFRENSVGYFQECNNAAPLLLRDNLLAVKKLAKMLEQTFLDKEMAISGSLHHFE